jgi:transcriptional regulator with XRE-family HTH domain
MKPVYLRTRRLQLGYTQEHLAHLSHIAQNTISKLENYRHARPVFITVVTLARALEVDPYCLRFGPDPATRRTRRTTKGAAA